MWYNEDNFTVIIGSNKFTNVPNIIVYKGQSVFRITRAESTELLGIDFDLYDKAGNKIAVVKKGRIYEGDKERYKVEIGADRYQLIDLTDQTILCDIKKRAEANGAELDVNVNLYMPDGFLFQATPTATNIGGSIVSGSHISHCSNGIVIG